MCLAVSTAASMVGSMVVMRVVQMECLTAENSAVRTAEPTAATWELQLADSKAALLAAQKAVWRVDPSVAATVEQKVD